MTTFEIILHLQKILTYIIHSIITRFNNLDVVEEGIKKTAWSVLSHAFHAGLVKHISILKQKIPTDF